MKAYEPSLWQQVLDGGPLMLFYLVMLPVWIAVSVQVIRAKLGADFLWMPPLCFALLAMGVFALGWHHFYLNIQETGRFYDPVTLADTALVKTRATLIVLATGSISIFSAIGIRFCL